MIYFKLAGIYKISQGDYYYIGMSTDIFNRWGSHYNNLKLNKHSSPKFQQMWNNSKPEMWKWEILESISLTNFKSENKLKGKQLEKSFRQHILNKEKEWMSIYSINFALNKDNKHFK